jgi:hypothetical protein
VLRTHRRTVVRHALAAAAIALLAAGCATPGHASVPGSARSTSPSAPSAVPSSPLSASPSGQPAIAARAAAVAEARRILGTFRPPAGAVRLTEAPKDMLLVPDLGTSSVPEYQIDDIAWFSVPYGGAEHIVMHTAQPPGSSFGGSGNGGTPGGGVEYGIAYDWPVITGVLTDRTLEVSAQTSGGTTYIRVDAIAAWQPPRDPRSLVPATATSVTITYRGATSPMRTPPAMPPLTTSDPAQVAAIVRAVNAAQVWPNAGRMMCPMDNGARMTVEFRAGADGPMVATAEITTSGCADVRMTVPGGADAVLDGGRALAIEIGKIVHRPWPGV